MAEPVPFRRPINWLRLRADEAERIVRQRVKDTDNVIIGSHAYDRLDERASGGLINPVDVYNILESGYVDGQPALEDGEWKVVIVKRMPGRREAGVVTLFAKEGTTLFVKTVQWMDLL